MLDGSRICGINVRSRNNLIWLTIRKAIDLQSNRYKRRDIDRLCCFFLRFCLNSIAFVALWSGRFECETGAVRG